MKLLAAALGFTLASSQPLWAQQAVNPLKRLGEISDTLLFELFKYGYPAMNATDAIWLGHMTTCRSSVYFRTEFFSKMLVVCTDSEETVVATATTEVTILDMGPPPSKVLPYDLDEGCWDMNSSLLPKLKILHEGSCQISFRVYDVMMVWSDLQINSF